MATTRSSQTSFRQLRFFTIEWTPPRPACPWILLPPRLCTAAICQRRSSHSSGTIRTLRFPMEFPPSKFLTTRRTYRFQPRYISPISPRVQFRRMRRWKAPATRTEIGTFWSIWRRAAETILRFMRCGRESTKTVPGPIPRTRFGPTSLRIALTPQGKGTSDAAGLPVGPLLANADEVIGTGTPSCAERYAFSIPSDSHSTTC